MSVTFSRVPRPAKSEVMYTAYCVACGRSASLDLTDEEERQPRASLLAQRKLRTMLLHAGCNESGVTAAIPAARRLNTSG